MHLDKAMSDLGSGYMKCAGMAKKELAQTWGHRGFECMLPRPNSVSYVSCAMSPMYNKCRCFNIILCIHILSHLGSRYRLCSWLRHGFVGESP